MGILDLRDSLYVDEGAIRESMESLRSWEWKGYGYEDLLEVSIRRGYIAWRIYIPRLLRSGLVFRERRRDDARESRGLLDGGALQ